MNRNSIGRTRAAVARFVLFSATLSGLALAAAPAMAGPFTAGNIVAYRVYNSSTGGISTTAGNAVYLDEYAPDGTLVQSIAMPTAFGSAPLTNPLTASSTGSEGLLNRTVDGTCLTVPGYAATPGTTYTNSGGSAVFNTPTTGNGAYRVVGFVDNNGNVDTSTTLAIKAFAGSNFRGAISDSCGHVWTSGNGTGASNYGIWYASKGASGAATQILTTAVNSQGMAIDGSGQLYASFSSANFDAIGTGLPTTTGQAVTAVSGVIKDNYRGISFLTLQSASGPSDTLYLINNNATPQQLDKYSLVGGVWTAKGYIDMSGVAGTLQGLAAVKLGDGNVALYITNGKSGIIYRAIDDTGPTGSLVSTTSYTNFATATGASVNAVFYGLALAPVAALPAAAPGVPTNLAAASLGTTSFSASWSAPAGGADAYVIEVSTDSAFATINQTILQSAVSTATTAVPTAVTVSGLPGTTGGTFYFRVRALNGYGASADAPWGVNVSQAITFGTAPVITAIGGTGVLSATASSGLPVVFASTTPTVCTVSGATVTSVSAGICTVTADQAGNTEYNAAPEVTQTFGVGGLFQTIVFGTAPVVVVGGTGALSATASSGLSVVYGSTTPAVCTVSASTVSGVTAGTCTVTADQGGNAAYLPATEVTQAITIGQGAQTIGFGAAPSVTFGGTATVTATATSGLPVSFSSSTPAVCTISGATVTGVSVGTCTIVASQAGNANYLAATAVSTSFPVGPAIQTIGFVSVPSVVVGGNGSLAASASSGLTPVTFSSTTPGVCSVSGNTVSGVGAGTCTIAATQSGNASYAAATAEESFAVSNAITAFTPGSLVVNTFINVNNGGANLDSAVPVVLQQFQLDPTGAIASQTGTLTLPQTASGGQAAISGEFGSASEGMLAQSTNGLYLTLMGYGVNATDFNGGGTAVYGTSALGQSTSLPAAAQTGTVVTTVPRVVALIGANASVDTSTALVNLYDQNNPRSVATLDGTAFWTSGQGSSTSDPSQGVDYALLGATSATPIDNSTDTRTVAFVNSGSGNALWVSRDRKSTATNISLLATAGGAVPTSSVGLVTTPEVLPVSSLSTNPNASITLSAATVNGVNNARLGNFVYLSPEQFFLASPTVLYVTDSGQPKSGSANAGALGEGGLQKWILVNGTWTLAYDLVNGLNLVNNATANAATPTAPGVTGLLGLTGRVVGTQVQLFASSYGLNELSQSYLYAITDDINATTITQAAAEQFTVLFTDPSGQTSIRGIAFAPGLQQQIAFAAAPAISVTGVATVAATGGASGNPVVLTSLTSGVCTISGATVMGVAAGTCTIAANQAGNASYSPATQATLSFPVALLAQTIVFNALPDQQLGAAPSTLSATADSGLPVSFSSSTPGICAVNGTTLSLVSAGICTITASQPGDGVTYAAAVPVTQGFTVAPASTGGSGGNPGSTDGDVPLPDWAYVLLAACLIGALSRARGARGSPA